MLDEIANVVVNKLDKFELIIPISMKTDLIRVRIDNDTEHKTAAALGTPPAQFANQSNRMSPAGVPMFYGAYDLKTAFSETFDPEIHEGAIASVGTFRPLRQLRILDLANLPNVPSIFDEDEQHLIHPLRFLHSFASDISKPIQRDGREHIDYVPTQIVTEYFRRIFKIDNQCIDGISYRSSKKGGEIAFVLFCENEQCIDGDPIGHESELLQLVSAEHFKAST